MCLVSDVLTAHVYGSIMFQIMFLYCTVYDTVPDAHLTEREQLPEVVVRGDQRAQYHWLLELLHSMHLVRKLHRGEGGGIGGEEGG